MRPVAGAELGEDRADVPLDRLRGEEERLSDLRIRLAGGDEREDLALALAQMGPAALGIVPTVRTVLLAGS